MSDDSEPKYRKKGFMAKSLELYYAARLGTRATARNGDNSGPIGPIEPVGPATAPGDTGWNTDDTDINTI